MSKLTDVFYLLGNCEEEYSYNEELRKEIDRESAIYDRFCMMLDEEQRKVFEEYIECEASVQSKQEGIVAAKGVALGIKLASEAFLINTNGDDYELFKK